MEWFKRNRRRLIWTTVAAASGGVACYTIYRAYSKSVSRLTNYSDDKDDVRNDNPALLSDKVEIERVFHKVFRIVSSKGFSNWSVELESLLRTRHNVKEATDKLKQIAKQANAKSSKDLMHEKILMWKELTIVTFAQAVSVVWALALLNAFASVQLMVIARISQTCNENNEKGSAHKTRLLLEEHLHKIIKHFMEHTVNKICAVSRRATESALQTVDLKRKMKFSEIIGILACISCTTEFELGQDIDSGSMSWSQLLLLEYSDEDSIPEVLDFYKSVEKVLQGLEFQMCINSSAKCISDAVISNCHQLFKAQCPKATVDNGENHSMPLAKIVPLVSAASEGAMRNSNALVEDHVFKLQEMVRVCADAFSVNA